MINEQTEEEDEERDFIRLRSFSEHLLESSLRFNLEKIRGLIRSKKMLETVRSGARALGGRWSKIEERISGGMCDVAGIVIGVWELKSWCEVER